MSVGLYVGFFVGGESARTRLDINPPSILRAYLAFVAFAAIADEMSTFIWPDPLPPDFLAADSTDKVRLYIFHDHIS